MKKFFEDFLKEWWLFFTVVTFIILARVFVFGSVIVDGHSMDPALQNKEQMITLKRAKIQRFDIVVSKEPGELKKRIVKRVIGLSGDTVTYDHDQLYINGKKYAEPYLDKYKKLLKKDKLQKTYDYNYDFQKMAQRVNAFTVNYNNEVKFTIKVPFHHYLLLGDNRPISKDSRYPSVGPIPSSIIEGEIKFVFWPPKRIRLMEKNK
ncbi:MAG: signal peptidase I [Streptococcaceae bacterium]|jgi:signal peptidase I|nr:signal peptidase I [Streptococcaceae bacterium]